MTTQQLLAIVSASGIDGSNVTVNFHTGPGADTAYENAIAMIETAGGSVTRRVQELSSTGAAYEVAAVDQNEHGISDFQLIGPFGHRSYHPEQRINLTPEAKVALRVIPGGVA